jgi:dihydrodipicolinate reductase
LIVSIEHTAHNREGFALRAIIAAEWIVGKQDLHNERRFRIKINQINF